MPRSNDGQVSGFYISKWIALLPFVLFVLLTVGFSFKGVFGAEVMAAMGVLGLAAGSLFSRNQTEYWNSVVQGLGDHTGMLVVAIFLIVGIYSKLMAEARLAEGLIWLAGAVGFKGALFAAFVYIASAVFGVATGTALGTIVTMGPVLFPAAVAMGVSPALAAGAILSGAATGDHFAPVSDTTIISATSQRYRTREGNADIGGVVKARMIYVIPAFLIAIILYLALGGGGGGAGGAEEIIAKYRHARGLFMILPIAVVIYLAVSGRSVFQSLLYGIITGSITGLASGLLTWSDFVSIEGRNVNGIIVDGVESMLAIVVMIMILMASFHLIRHYGLMDIMIGGLKRRFAKTPKAAELMMFASTSFLNFLLIGSTGRISVIAGPINDELGSGQNIHPYRRANITDAATNSFSYMMPWHIWAFVLLATIRPLVSSYEFITVPAPSSFFMTTFYPAAIWLIMLFSILTGFGRSYEGKDGAVVKAWYKNDIPDEAPEFERQ